MIKEW